ncbi:uncharacterized protein LOC123529218 [Mercenaria mercenaria]|uniref:uncharacterized protein LOC123529218 n=1 Tax=Mercenaria mercenaria TaxID=6596 RepID=UPI00234E83FC|nr:uncharacterized protein LOC123529218 [Mercenaria mercenaria]
MQLKSSPNKMHDELKEDVRYLRRKVRKLEERIASLASAKTEENPDDAKLALVEHLEESDVQQVLTTMTFSIFSKDDLLNCSRTGKRTGKCVGTPRPPLDVAKLDMLERLVRKKPN